MGKSHIKRLAMPKALALPRKSDPWVTRPMPGPHSKDASVPLLVAIRDYLHLCDNSREGKRILGSRRVYVDNKPVREHKFPVGFMDVLSLPDMDRWYRVLLDERGKLRFVEIEKERGKWKLARIEGKHYVKGRKVQITLHDGRNILLSPSKAGKYHVGDTLKITIPEQKIIDHYPLKEGNVAMIIGGKHAGEVGVINRYEVVQGPIPNRVYFEGGISTIKEHTFVVGKTRAEIIIPEKT